MKLFVKGDYHNGAIGATYFAGQTIEIEDAVGEFLLRDAPENFMRVLPSIAPFDEALDSFTRSLKKKAPDAPPRDKAVKAPPRKKAAG